MTPTLNIEALIEEALNLLREKTGLDGAVTTHVRPHVDDTIEIKKGKRVWRFDLIVRPWLTRPIIDYLKERIRIEKGGKLLVTRFVTPGQAEELRAMNLAFLDTVGNAFINQEDLYLLIEGQRTQRDRKTQKADLFRPAELKVLFAFLCREGLEAKTHAEIKEMTGVGIGTINRLIRALEHAGFILKLKGHTRRLVRERELLDQWVATYPHRLRPKQIIGTFIGPQGPWWMEIDPVAFDAQWGGEIAAKKLTQYLKPQTVTIYAAKQPTELIIKQKLRKNPDGDVEILRRFWDLDKLNLREDVVPPLLVYADLLATGDDRNIETAHMIYEQHLTRLIKEG